MGDWLSSLRVAGCRREKALAAGGQQTVEGDVAPTSSSALAVSAADNEKVATIAHNLQVDKWNTKKAPK